MASLEESAIPFRDTRGDEKAFDLLVRDHGSTLARYVRCRIVNPSDAEDVLQETLVAAWRGFHHLRAPEHAQVWLMSVARNRCRDYFRARTRREMPLDEEALQDHANRFGLRQYRHANVLADVMDALAAAPEAAKETTHRFYLEGMTIAEIADDSRVPPGTVKRRLFQARHAARAFLGIPSSRPQTRTENTIMTAQTTRTTAENPPIFPPTRPEIRVTELDEPPFAVDCRELRSWPIIPLVGEQAASGDYFAPDWRLDEASFLEALRGVKIHDVDGVEIEARSWKMGSGWQRPGTVCARLTGDKAEYLAVSLPHEEFTQIETFLDSWFAWNWGALERTIADRGIVRRNPDGSLQLSEAGAGIVAGVARVEIGGKAFTCLRVLDIPETADLAAGGDCCYYIAETFLTREGRTVLVRRYCQPRFAEIAQFPVVLDESNRMIINETTFFHWYNTVTQAAF